MHLASVYSSQSFLLHLDAFTEQPISRGVMNTLIETWVTGEKSYSNISRLILHSLRSARDLLFEGKLIYCIILV